MIYVKVSNLIQDGGHCDYKGLDVSSIASGSQMYPEGTNTAYLGYYGVSVEHEDIEIISEEEHTIKRTEIENAPKPKTDIDLLQDQVALMQAAIDDLILGGVL